MWGMLAFVFFAVIGLLAYFSRNKITYTPAKGTGGNWMNAAIVAILIGLVGYGLDWYFSWTLILQFAVACGGMLQLFAWLAVIATIAMVLSMLAGAKKNGMSVA